MNFGRSQSLISVLLLACLVSMPACLKTRTQMKGGSNEDDAGEEAPSGAQAKPTKGMRYEMEELKNEMTRLSGKVDQVEYQQRGQNGAETKDAVGKLENRIAELEKNQTLIMSELQELKEKQDTAARASASSSKALLAEGYKLFKAKKYEESAEKFKLVLVKSPKGKDAAEAYFGLGEVEFQQKNYKKAIVEFSKVQDAAAKSELIPASLYKIGQSFSKLGMKQEAKGFFGELLEKYPKSPEAKKLKGKSGE
jgi:TolA-binding protein